MRDALGQRGEAIFTVLMTEFHSQAGPIFRPQFLGDKWPCVDFILELVGETGSIQPYCFVQVKTTRQGYTQRDRRLKVQLGAEQVTALAAYPAPTYLVGIDELNEQGYIVSINGETRAAVSSLTTEFPLDHERRELLWAEVLEYWMACAVPAVESRFCDVRWR